MKMKKTTLLRFLCQTACALMLVNSLAYADESVIYRTLKDNFENNSTPLALKDFKPGRVVYQNHDRGEVNRYTCRLVGQNGEITHVDKMIVMKSDDGLYTDYWNHTFAETNGAVVTDWLNWGTDSHGYLLHQTYSYSFNKSADGSIIQAKLQVSKPSDSGSFETFYGSCSLKAFTWVFIFKGDTDN